MPKENQMASTLPPPLLRLRYHRAAEEYCAALPLEHFMESTAQATQRKITLESLDLVHARRPEVQVFNELLLQYPFGRRQTIHQVVPDNMVIVHKEPIQAEGSYDLPFQPVKPFLAMEYVSKNSKRKDYEESFQKYERELKIDYYLVFYPDNQELTLYRHNGRKYVSVKPNDQGRLSILELELEVAILDGWVRYWHQGKLLPLPAEIQEELERTQQKLTRTEQELAQVRADLEKALRKQKNGR
jgi:Uma2 family endonuclease